jgi:hypothetical protein
MPMTVQTDRQKLLRDPTSVANSELSHAYGVRVD